MALPKRGLRKFEYNGHVYGWLIRKKPTYSQGLRSRMTLAIQEMGCASPKVLHVTLNIDRPDNWLAPHETQIRPAHIGKMIDGATKEGWAYGAGGPAFEYEYGVIKHR